MEKLSFQIENMQKYMLSGGPPPSEPRKLGASRPHAPARAPRVLGGAYINLMNHIRKNSLFRFLFLFHTWLTLGLHLNLGDIPDHSGRHSSHCVRALLSVGSTVACWPVLAAACCAVLLAVLQHLSKSCKGAGSEAIYSAIQY